VPLIAAVVSAGCNEGTPLAAVLCFLQGVTKGFYTSTIARGRMHYRGQVVVHTPDAVPSTLGASLPSNHGTLGCHQPQGLRNLRLQACGDPVRPAGAGQHGRWGK